MTDLEKAKEVLMDWMVDHRTIRATLQRRLNWTFLKADRIAKEYINTILS